MAVHAADGLYDLLHADVGQAVVPEVQARDARKVLDHLRDELDVLVAERLVRQGQLDPSLYRLRERHWGCAAVENVIPFADS